MKVSERKIQVTNMIRPDQMKFLEKKINKNIPKLASRSAVIEVLIDYAMERPEILVLDIDK